MLSHAGCGSPIGGKQNKELVFRVHVFACLAPPRLLAVSTIFICLTIIVVVAGRFRSLVIQPATTRATTIVPDNEEQSATILR